MVSSRSEYKFSEDLEKIKVDGGIMPHRSGGHEFDCRGEDIAFLGEAANEMVYVLGVHTDYGPVYISMEDTRLFAYRPANIATLFNSLENDRNTIIASTGSAFSWRNVLHQVDPQSEPNWTFSGNMDVFSGIRQTPQWSSDPDDFQSGGIVKRDPIMQLFHDSQRIKASVAAISAYLENATYSVERQGYEMSAFGNVYGYTMYDGHETTQPQMVGWARRSVSGGRYEFTVGNYGVKFTARAYYALRLRDHWAPSASSSSTNYWIDLFSAPATVSGRVVSVNSSVLLEAARQMVARYTTEHGTGVNATLQSLSVDVIAGALQRIRGGHTLYDS